jgi:hypothetical protein
VSAPGLYASEAGELNALRKLSSTDDAQADVIVELLDSVKPSGKVLPALVQAAVNVAQFDRTLWLDTTWLTAGSPLAQQRGGFSSTSTTSSNPPWCRAWGSSPSIGPAWSRSSRSTPRTTNYAGSGC